MSPVAGFASCVSLREALRARFGRELVVDAIEPTQDGFGWKLASKPSLLFSASTYGGELPSGMFDVQVSVVDGTLENGEILFGPESPTLAIEGVCDLVARYLSHGEA